MMPTAEDSTTASGNQKEGATRQAGYQKYGAKR